MKNTMRMIGVLLCCGITGLMVQSALGHTFTNGMWFEVTITPPDDKSSYCEGVCENVAPGKSFEYNSDNTTVDFYVTCGTDQRDCPGGAYVGTVTWDNKNKSCIFQPMNSMFSHCNYMCDDEKIWLQNC